MPHVDRRRSSRTRPGRKMSPMELLFVLTLIVVLGLFAQVIGADSRGFGRGPAA